MHEATYKPPLVKETIARRTGYAYGKNGPVTRITVARTAKARVGVNT